MGMLSSLIRHHWWPNQYERAIRSGFSSSSEVDQSKLFVVAVMPCTAKKDEIARQQFQMASGQYETDAVLTVRELARLIELRGVAKRDDYESFKRIPKLFYDNPFGEGTGAAVLFGATGGVMEAALRTAADVLNGQSLDQIKYDAVRGLNGIKESSVMLGPNKEIQLNVAACHQMRNVREFLERIEAGESNYHFIEIMTCEGGCLGGGGLPQSRDPNAVKKRMESLYSKDERMVIRKSHENKAVQELYDTVLGHPLSHISHEWLHTNYFARPRKAPLALKAQSLPDAIELDGDTANTVCIVYGTQTGTTAQAAKEIKMELQSFISRSKVTPEPNVVLIAANHLPPEKLVEKVRGAMASLFVTCTYGEGEFPETMLKLWDHFENNCDSSTFPESSLRFGVFGLGSSQYSCGDQFNRSARLLDARLDALGGERLIEAGLGDDQAAEQYRGALEKWMEQLQPKLFGKASGGRSYLDPPKPLFQLSLAVSSCGGRKCRCHLFSNSFSLLCSLVCMAITLGRCHQTITLSS
jgi:flavodoxin